MFNKLTIILLWCCALQLQAQRHIAYSPFVKSIQVVAGQKWQEIPVVQLGTNEAINITFDWLSHEHQRFTYNITHLEYDWTPSDALISTDYAEGFTEELSIDSDQQSILTTQNYTHYAFSIPNDQCRLTMSGNYRVDVLRANTDDASTEEDTVLTAFFMVSEATTPLQMALLYNTDIDVQKNHQQVELAVNYSNLSPQHPRDQIKGYVLQNGRWSSAHQLPLAPIITQNTLKWEHNRQLIFPGGNEHHKFEILDIHRNSLGVTSTEWDGEQWHANLETDSPRPSYTYDESARGSFYIRNSNNSENDITSEYLMVHFHLKSPRLPYPVYVNAHWTNDAFLPEYRMNYDSKAGEYTLAVPLKYGYYSYQYLMLKPDGSTSLVPSEGSFYQTANKYTALIYYRGVTDRADRLVGVKTIQ